MNEVLLDMRKATETNDVEKVAKILEQVLSANVELGFKQKPILFLRQILVFALDSLLAWTEEAF